MNDLTIIGAGAWGCALALQAARAGTRVTLWARTTPRTPLPPEIHVTNTIPQTKLALLAVPTQALREIAAHLPAHTAVIAACKGVESTTHQFPLEILGPGRQTAILTGPNFAHEVAAGLPTAAVIASTNPTLREQTAALLGTPTFRLYNSDDPIGAQIGGAAKNVIAIAAGAVIGAGLGENARAALVTRGLAEIARLATALGGRSETIAGLSGLGDLLLTCTGPASRNFSLGAALGRGEPLASILATRTTITEGVATAPALVARADEAGVDLPISAAVAAILQNRTTLTAAIETLLARRRRDE